MTATSSAKRSVMFEPVTLNVLFNEIQGTDGNDTLNGTAQDDLINGNGGDDFLYGGDGNDSLNGGSGKDDKLVGGSGSDTLTGGGSNTIADYYSEVLNGGTQGVVVDLQSGIATDSYNFTDTLINVSSVDATNFDDLIRGDDNGNNFTTFLGEDTIDGRGGFDQITYYWSNSGIIVDLSANYIKGAGDEFYHTVYNIESVRGSSSNDSMLGDALNNTFMGLEGNDTLNGGGGFDRIRYDRDDRNGGTLGVTVDLSLGYAIDGFGDRDIISNIEAVDGTNYADSIKGTNKNNSLSGLSGNDTLNGNGGADTLIGGNGDDTYITDGGDLITESVDAGTDTVQSSVTHTLVANLENLTLTGTSAINGTGNELANVLLGNTRANTLVGGAGADTLIGGAGKDLLSGGLHNDVFVFRTMTESGTATTTMDVITDFVQGQDKIDLSQIDAFTGGTADDAFIWIEATAFQSTTSGEVRYQRFDNKGTTNDYTLVYLDNDGDTGIESTIRLTGLYTLTADDFIL